MTQQAYQRILLAVDLGHDDESIGRRSAELVPHFGAKLSIVYVIEPLPIDVVADPYATGVPILPDHVDLERERLEKSEQRLKQYAEQMGFADADLYARPGTTKSAILDLARELNVDLIILGSHGRSGLARLLGSTASAVIHQAHCDVLTVRIIDNA